MALPETGYTVTVKLSKNVQVAHLWFWLWTWCVPAPKNCTERNGPCDWQIFASPVLQEELPRAWICKYNIYDNYYEYKRQQKKIIINIYIVHGVIAVLQTRTLVIKDQRIRATTDHRISAKLLLTARSNEQLWDWCTKYIFIPDVAILKN